VFVEGRTGESAHGRKLEGSERDEHREGVSRALGNCTIHWVRMKIKSVTETGKRHLFSVKSEGKNVSNGA
jgi:hypothetical protein